MAYAARVAEATAQSAIISQFLTDSLVASGTATAPGAGTAIATLAAPPAGLYSVAVLVSVGTAAAAAENSNMQLKVGATAFGAVPIPGVAGATAGMTYILSLSGVDAITINAVGAGTAAVVYGATISATRIR